MTALYRWNPDRSCHEAHPIRNYRCVVWPARKSQPDGFPWHWEVRRFGARGTHVAGGANTITEAKRIARAAAFALAGPKAVPL